MTQPKTIVHRISLASADIARDRLLLSAKELARADRFVVPLPREQFIACRAALRRLLAERLECDPTAIRFNYSRLGKPTIDFGPLQGIVASRPELRRLQFSVSHSGQWGLIALSQQPLGVDIEKLQPQIKVLPLKSQIASPSEIDAWDSLAAKDQRDQIIRLWVCKEALLKAMGLGIAECLQQVSFHLPIESTSSFCPANIAPAVQIHLEEPANCSLHQSLFADNWTMQSIAVAEEYFAAIAVLGKGSQVELV